MAVVAVIRALHESLQFWYIVRVSKVNDINCNIVPLKTLAKVLALSKIFFDRVSHEDNYTLALLLVHPVLEWQLANFYGVEEAGEAV